MIDLLEMMRERLSADTWQQLATFAQRHRDWSPDELVVEFNLANGQLDTVLAYFDASNSMAELAAAEGSPSPQVLAQYWRGVAGAGLHLVWPARGDVPRGVYVRSPRPQLGFRLFGHIDGQPELIGDLSTCPWPVDVSRLAPLEELGPVQLRYRTTGAGADIAVNILEVLPPPSSENMAEAQRLISMLLDADAVDHAFLGRLLAIPPTPQVLVSAITVSPYNTRQGTILLGARPATGVKHVEAPLLN